MAAGQNVSGRQCGRGGEKEMLGIGWTAAKTVLAYAKRVSVALATTLL